MLRKYDKSHYSRLSDSFIRSPNSEDFLSQEKQNLLGTVNEEIQFYS